MTITKTKNKNLVSIIIPTKNRYKLLKRAVDSILSQTYKNLEIVIVDDGSTDNTELIIKELMSNNKHIIYSKLKNAKGANAARNQAIKLSSGEFITGLDDDDEMMPDRVEKMVSQYDNSFAYIFSGYELITKTFSILQVPSHSIITQDMMLCTNMTGSQVLTTKAMFLKAGLYDESLGAAQDYDMWLRLLEIIPRAKAIKEPLMKVYAGHQQISSSPLKLKGYLQCYNKHKKNMSIHQRKMRLFELRYKIKKHDVKL